MITTILGADDAWGIGKKDTRNGLPWESIPADLQHFKDETIKIGRIVMGAETARAIFAYRKGKPLPDRIMAVLSTTMKEPLHPSMPVFNSIPKIEDYFEGKDYAVIGGAKTYDTYAPLTDKIIVSKISGIYAANCYFNQYILRDFELKHEKILPDIENKYPKVTVQYYDRKK